MLPWGALEVAWGTPRVDWEYISAGIGQSHGLPRSGLNVTRVDPEPFPAGRCSGILETSQQFFEAAWGGGGGRDPLPPWARPPGAPALSGGIARKCPKSVSPPAGHYLKYGKVYLNIICIFYKNMCQCETHFCFKLYVKVFRKCLNKCFKNVSKSVSKVSQKKSPSMLVSHKYM